MLQYPIKSLWVFTVDISFYYTNSVEVKTVNMSVDKDNLSIMCFAVCHGASSNYSGSDTV
jgi:hypothetical protein